ncbi:MAG TPA: 1-deoxy-D-xylulose-5-phosphate synthase N-terminal domain-containing protein, partial [Jatrophihabitantaceae bacterium]|nr:1-deoxy-D-xylulose-5-phosphate synthase N-terminal domain-containing protein [Jatrophihabitantaceae bacterium]
SIVALLLVTALSVKGLYPTQASLDEAVELTIALHRVFDSPAEPILFDVGQRSAQGGDALGPGADREPDAGGCGRAPDGHP